MARDWSQRDLAAAIEDQGIPMAQGTLSRIESGERIPQYPEVKALAEVFGVSIDALGAESFESTLEWTKVQGEFRDARQRLQEAADAYEEASRAMLAELPYAPSSINDVTREALDIGARRSCVEVAWRQYKAHRTGRSGVDEREKDLGDDDIVLVMNQLNNDGRRGSSASRR